MKTSGTMNSATGHTSVSTRTGNFNDGLYDRAGARPDLDLDFARTKSLKDRVSKEDLITFTRGSGGTYVDESGLVKNARTNIHAHHAEVGPNHLRSGLVSLENPKGQITNVSFWTIAEKYNGLNGDVNNFRSGTQTGNDGSVITGSVYLRTNTGTVTVGIDCCDRDSQTVTVTDQWQRFSATTLGETGVNTAFRFFDMLIYNTAAGGATTLYGWGAQVETGGVATLPVIENTVAGGGAPRFTHDPVTKESKGLLIEQAVTNYMQSSTAISGDTTATENWVGYNTRIAYDNSITNPDGSTEAAYQSNSASEIYQFFDTSGYNSNAGTDTITLSCFVKARSGITGAFIIELFSQQDGAANPDHNNNLGQVIRFDPLANNGDGEINSDVVADTSDRTITNAKIQKYPNGWFRISCTVFVKPYTHDSATYSKFLNKSRFDIQGVGHSTNNNGKHYFWGAQVEVGNVLTSFIRTSGSTVTRSRDLASIEGSNFGTYRANMLNAVSPNLGLNNTGVTTSGVSVIENTTNMTIAPYSALAPDGTFSAVRMEDDDLGSTSAVRQISYRIGNTIATDQGNGPLLSNTTYTVSGYFKAGTASKASFWLAGTDWATPPTPQQWINLSDGSLLGATSVATANNATVTDAGNGWYRLSLRCTTGSSITNNLKLRINSVIPTGTQHSISFSGKAGSFYMWGLQIEEGTSVTPYIPSTDTYTNRQSNATFVDGNGIVRTSYANLAPYSEDFSNSEWVKNSSTITLNTTETTAPYGTNTASKLEVVNETDGHRLLDQNISLGPHLYTFSVFIKPNTTNHVLIKVYKSGATADNILYKRYKFDTEETTGERGSLVVEKYPNGWYRLIGTTIADSNTANSSITIGLLQNSTTTETFTGNGESLYVWGAQIVKGTEAADYYKTTGTISGPPRYSHDPETLTPTGLYLEAKTVNNARDTERLGSLTSSGDTSDVHIAGPYTFSNSKRKTETGITNPDGSTDGTCVITVDSGTHNRQQPRGFRLPNVNSLVGRQVQSVFVKRKTSTARYVLLFMGGTGTYQQCLLILIRKL